MPNLWRAALRGEGDVNLSAAQMQSPSQHLLIPSGFMGGLTKLVAQRALGNNVHSIPKDEWHSDIKASGFRGSLVFMDEPVLNIPSVLRALADPYKNAIRKITEDQANAPFEYLKDHNIAAKRIIFTSAASNYTIACQYGHDKGLETQKRPLVQGIMKNAPFPLFAHLVGKTDKPVASITSHYIEDGTLVWYLGGGVAECKKETNPQDIIKAALKGLQTYLPHIDFSNVEWATLPIDRVEGKSKTDSWMPDTPTIHHTEDALYCWPTKLTFAPMLSDMILDELNKHDITPSQNASNFDFLPQADYAKPPWDNVKWKK